MGVGNFLFREGDDFLCMKDTDLIAINNSGAFFLLIYSLLLLSFTLMIWYAFYKIPDNYGFISKVRTNNHLILKSKELTDTYVENLISISKEDHLIVASPRIDRNELSSDGY